MAIALLTLLSFTAVPALAQKPAAGQGHLYLVGLGSGDRDNMTIRAKKIIDSADIIFGMRHIEKQYADMINGRPFHDAGHGLFVKNIPHLRNAEKVKALAEKNRDIIRKAVAEGKTVAILAGGDPMIFSPHTGYLQEFADLNPEVIPGLSCFNAANAALQRTPTWGHASKSVTLTAAMSMRPDYKGQDSLAKLAATKSTLVFFTMRAKLPEVVEELKKHYSADTPIAIVLYAGYRDKQKVLKATLDTIIEATKGQKLPFEHLIYVGDFLK
jgi:precorrin-4 methylase